MRHGVDGLHGGLGKIAISFERGRLVVTYDSRRRKATDATVGRRRDAVGGLIVRIEEKELVPPRIDFADRGQGAAKRCAPCIKPIDRRFLVQTGACRLVAEKVVRVEKVVAKIPICSAVKLLGS